MTDHYTAPSLNTHNQTSILPWESLIQTFHQKICIASNKNWEKIKQQKCKWKVSHNGILIFIFGKLQLQSVESRGEELGRTRQWLPQTLSRSGLSLTGKNFDKFNENSRQVLTVLSSHSHQARQCPARGNRNTSNIVLGPGWLYKLVRKSKQTDLPVFTFCEVIILSLGNVLIKTQIVNISCWKWN